MGVPAILTLSSAGWFFAQYLILEFICCLRIKAADGWEGNLFSVQIDSFILLVINTMHQGLPVAAFPTILSVPLETDFC